PSPRVPDLRCELLRRDALLADQQRIGHQIGRTFVQLIEEQGHGAMIDRCRPAGLFDAWRTGALSSSSSAGCRSTRSRMAPPPWDGPCSTPRVPRLPDGYGWGWSRARGAGVGRGLGYASWRASLSRR